MRSSKVLRFVLQLLDCQNKHRVEIVLAAYTTRQSPYSEHAVLLFQRYNQSAGIQQLGNCLEKRWTVGLQCEKVCNVRNRFLDDVESVWCKMQAASASVDARKAIGQVPLMSRSARPGQSESSRAPIPSSYGKEEKLWTRKLTRRRQGGIF